MLFLNRTFLKFQLVGGDIVQVSEFRLVDILQVVAGRGTKNEYQLTSMGAHRPLLEVQLEQLPRLDLVLIKHRNLFRNRKTIIDVHLKCRARIKATLFQALA